jgi:hypothetical protein
LKTAVANRYVLIACAVDEDHPRKRLQKTMRSV